MPEQVETGSFANFRERFTTKCKFATPLLSVGSPIPKPTVKSEKNSSRWERTPHHRRDRGSWRRRRHRMCRQVLQEEGGPVQVAQWRFQEEVPRRSVEAEIGCRDWRQLPPIEGPRSNGWPCYTRGTSREQTCISRIEIPCLISLKSTAILPRYTKMIPTF